MNGVYKKNLAAELEAVRAAHPGKTLQLWCEDGEAPEPLSREGQKGRTGHRGANLRFRLVHPRRAPARAPGQAVPVHLYLCSRPSRPRRRVRPGAARGEGRDHCEIAERFARDVFLSRFAETLPAGVHAVLMLDQAGWHGRAALQVPGNITLLPLPPYSPELNPVERAWLYLRERFLSFRLYRSEQAIVDALCAAWNALRDETGRLATLTGFPWITQAINQVSK